MWIAFVVTTLALAAYTTYRFYGDRMLFVPGQTTAGHHQIETECFVCHTPMAGVKSDACVSCHGAELERIDDSHPKSKFTDPRNADLLSKLDARECVACHIEHRPERTLAMGVTQPNDFCHHCHADIADDRPSHKGMAFDTCQNAACHNFHDNRVLHEDYLGARLDVDPQHAVGMVAVQTVTGRARREFHGSALTREDADAPKTVHVSDALLKDWASTLHAEMGVNCAACHTLALANGQRGAWTDAVTFEHCKSCHDSEVDAFLGSRHGMRLHEGLAPMRVADAWLPMREDAAEQRVTCNSCHGAHQFDRDRAAVESCVGCHDDQHSRAYLKSKHYALWQHEVEGGAAGTGVSCATCHLPREADFPGGVARVRHNQNDFLRPNEKMLETVCVRCHSAQMAFDALADPSMIAAGVNGAATVHTASLEMVRRKHAARSTERGADP